MKEGRKIFIAASGSGGHLLPARYIAEALRSKDPQMQIAFIGSGRPLEKTLIEDYGFTLHRVTVHGIAGRGILGYLQALIEYPIAAITIWGLLRKEKPDLVVGVGGYVSVLPVSIASFTGIRTWIHEAELKAGLATKVLARFADTISLAFKDAIVPYGHKSIVTGHPLRPEIVTARISNRDQISALFITGGSQGSLKLDTSLPAAIAALKKTDIRVRHQVRQENLQLVKELYSKHGIAAEVAPFFHDMIECYNEADLVIARAGAGTVKELEFIRKPCILIPLPAVSGHQRSNAQTLARSGQATIVEEGEDFQARLVQALEQRISSRAQDFGSANDTIQLPQTIIAEEICRRIQ